MDSKDAVLQLFGSIAMSAIILSFLYAAFINVTDGEKPRRVALAAFIMTICIMLLIRFCNMWWMALPYHPLPR